MKSLIETNKSKSRLAVSHPLHLLVFCIIKISPTDFGGRSLPGGWYTVSLRNIQKLTNISKTTLRRYLDELNESGYIIKCTPHNPSDGYKLQRIYGVVREVDGEYCGDVADMVDEIKRFGTDYDLPIKDFRYLGKAIDQNDNEAKFGTTFTPCQERDYDENRPDNGTGVPYSEEIGADLMDNNDNLAPPSDVVNQGLKPKKDAKSGALVDNINTYRLQSKTCRNGERNSSEYAPLLEARGNEEELGNRKTALHRLDRQSLHDTQNNITSSALKSYCWQYKTTKDCDQKDDEEEIKTITKRDIILELLRRDCEVSKDNIRLVQESGQYSNCVRRGDRSLEKYQGANVTLIGLKSNVNSISDDPKEQKNLLDIAVNILSDTGVIVFSEDDDFTKWVDDLDRSPTAIADDATSLAADKYYSSVLIN